MHATRQISQARGCNVEVPIVQPSGRTLAGSLVGQLRQPGNRILSQPHKPGVGVTPELLPKRLHARGTRYAGCAAYDQSKAWVQVASIVSSVSTWAIDGEALTLLYGSQCKRGHLRPNWVTKADSLGQDISSDMLRICQERTRAFGGNVTK
jgi:hypothetical protein